MLIYSNNKLKSSFLTQLNNVLIYINNNKRVPTLIKWGTFITWTGNYGNWSYKLITLRQLKLIKLLDFLDVNLINIHNIINILNYNTQFSVKIDELELKGINYRFCKFKTNLLLDLGCSHFQLFFYPKTTFYLGLRKKKLKRIIFVNFTLQSFSSTLSFFWYTLKSVGPYKLKGFQHINERIKLKQGKKPFK